MDIRDQKAITTNDPSSRIANLSPAKAQLLIQRLKERKGGSATPQTIPRREGSNTFAPLSYAQERLWLLDQLEFGIPAFNIPRSNHIRGEISLPALMQTFNEVVRRHDVLRTTFALVEGQAAQFIHPADARLMPVVDLSGLSEAEREGQVRLLSREGLDRPIHLDKEWSLRTTLLRKSDREALLVMTAHHIAFDAWSWKIYDEEMTAIYMDFAGGKPSSLPEPPIQYADYAVWQRLQGEKLEAQLAYWRQQLSGPPPLLELPTDRMRTARQIHVGAFQSTVLPRNLSEGLILLSHQEGSSLFMTLLAAFKALLMHHTGQRDVSVGTLISNRNQSQLEKLIGFFLNTLVLRTDLSGQPTFRDLIRRVRKVTLDAYAHAEIPFENVLEAVQPQRDSGLAPMFRVMFGLSNTPVSATMWLPTYESADDAIGKKWDDIDIALSIQQAGNELAVSIRYNLKLFEPVTIKRISGHFLRLLEGMVADPDGPALTTSMLTEAERHQVLTEWNDTRADHQADECFISLFEAQARRTPDAVAVVFEREQVTYRTLSRRSDQLASQFKKLGVEAEDLLAVMADRGIDFLIVMLATFKAGGAYLPLNPSDPPRRHHQVLADSGARYVLVADEILPDAARAFESIAPGGHPPLKSIQELLRLEDPPVGLDAGSMPRTLSYVIYTSGSTGVPKGAMVEQPGMLNHLYAKISGLQLTGADTVAQTASQTFDISVWQFLAALLVGGKICIISDEAARDPFKLLETVEREAVTILETVPSLLRVMVEEAPASATGRPDISSLRWLLVTGESLPPALCGRWLELYPDIPLLNAYGPTECSDDVTHCPIHQGPLTPHVPIGRPICNTRIYVLDAMMSPVAVTVSGELYVGGAGVGRGYLNDPARTAESFIPDPYSVEPGARQYKTGDVGRYRADGGVEFLGRTDHQVKIRGFRIELAEIEKVLEEHPALRQAVVLSREDRPGDKRLVTYLVPEQQSAPLPDDLHDYLQERVPDYMVPSAFVILGELPLTPNGKIDRNALPAPDESQLVGGEEFVAPDTPLEKKLADIWREVLKIERIGIYDNFFRLGGHSLMAIQVIHRINQAFSVDMPVRSIFDEPSIVGLALLIEETLMDRIEEELQQE